MTATISTFPSAHLPLLEAHSISCVRGDRELFSKLDIQIFAGECLHVRGENGAGKTSLLRILTGLSSPMAGEILWNGKSIQDAVDDYHRTLLFLGHRDALKEDLSAFENLKMYAALDRSPLTDQEVLTTLARFGLRAREDLAVGCLSAGQKKRVLMARMATTKTQIWILDEPFNALDASAILELQQLIVNHVVNNGAVIFTSHQHIDIPNLRTVDL